MMGKMIKNKKKENNLIKILLKEKRNSCTNLNIN